MGVGGDANEIPWRNQYDTVWTRESPSLAAGKRDHSVNSAILPFHIFVRSSSKNEFVARHNRIVGVPAAARTSLIPLSRGREIDCAHTDRAFFEAPLDS